MKYSIIFLLILTLTNCSLKNNLSNQQLNNEELELIDYLFKDAIGNKPGANVLVAKHGNIVFQKSYGLSNIEQGTRSTPQTNYRIASVSKSFTAMAIMILENQGALKYETTLKEIFPDFPNYGSSITIRYLLTHQSGLMDYDEFIKDDRKDQLLDKDVYDILAGVDSTYFTPGTEYKYSNSGYAVLSLIVEKISGQPFAEYLDKEIFKKLNMSTTEMYIKNNAIENRAFGYSIDKDSIFYNDQSLTSTIQGDGAIYCNLLDYLKWDQALYTNELIPQEKLLEAFYDYNGNNKSEDNGYGYGWAIDYKNGVKIIWHSGGTAGFESRVARIPSMNLTVVIFTNRDGHDRQNLHRTNSLISLFTDYAIPMPIEIIIKYEIDSKGVEHGISSFDRLKLDERYSVEETTLPFLGFEYYRLDEYEKAKALFIKATKENSNHFSGYYSLGLVYKKLENREKAIENFEKVIELGTGDEPWMFDRAKNYLKELKG